MYLREGEHCYHCHCKQLQNIICKPKRRPQEINRELKSGIIARKSYITVKNMCLIYMLMTCMLCSLLESERVGSILQEGRRFLLPLGKRLCTWRKVSQRLLEKDRGKKEEEWEQETGNTYHYTDKGMDKHTSKTMERENP